MDWRIPILLLLLLSASSPAQNQSEVAIPQGKTGTSGEELLEYLLTSNLSEEEMFQAIDSMNLTDDELMSLLWDEKVVLSINDSMNDFEETVDSWIDSLNKSNSDYYVENPKSKTMMLFFITLVVVLSLGFVAYLYNEGLVK